MSASASTTRSRPAARGRRVSRARVWKRRLQLALGFFVVLAAVLSLVKPVEHASREVFQLPLRHEDIIRQQAADKRVDASLIAAVIYTESRFRNQTSHAGATGLMQIMPETADYIARKSGGTQFTRADLATPQINISYGTWYLRYLLDKYNGNTILTLAAYNGGEGKVDEWRAVAAARGEKFRVASHVPFKETRDYVTRVLSARKEYRANYAADLGLN
jgi:soluble lytic murein transglycosylase